MDDYFVKKAGQNYFTPSKTTANVEEREMINEIFKNKMKEYEEARPKLIKKRYVIKQD
jgi:hypothetical protein